MSTDPQRQADQVNNAAAGAEEPHVDDAEASQPAVEPTLTELLTSTAQGETAAFSAFYDATSSVVYGMALLMHQTPESAAESTLALYQNLWAEADARARGLRLQSHTSQMLTDEHAESEQTYRPDEYELVLEWMVPLAHRIFLERFRDGSAQPIDLQVVPQSAGGSIAGVPEEVIEDLVPLSDSQVQALALTYLAGYTHIEVAEAVDAAIPTVKSRLRDALTRLHTQRTERLEATDPILRAAVTRRDVQLTGGVNRNFTQHISADLEKGLLLELAEIYAVGAIDEENRALLEEAALTADPADAHTWETRVLAAQRTLSEIFAIYPAVPPTHLLDDLLASVGDQEIGVGLVEDISNHTEVADAKAPMMKRWMLITGFLAVVIIGAIFLWMVLSSPDAREAADSDENAMEVDSTIVVETVDADEEGTISGRISEEEGLGYLDFSNIPELTGNDTYQVWLLPQEQRLPSSLGNFTASELEEDGIELRNLNDYVALQITVEQIRNEERPTGASVGEVRLP